MKLKSKILAYFNFASASLRKIMCTPNAPLTFMLKLLLDPIILTVQLFNW